MSQIILVAGASSGFGAMSARGGTPPCLTPFFAAKTAMDAVAVSYAGVLAPLGAT